MDFIIRKDADKKAVVTYIDRLPNCKRYDVRIETRKTVHPDDQCAVYRQWLAIVSADTGKGINDVHDFFRQKFLGFSVKRIFGEEVLKESLIEDLSQRELSYYLEKVRAYAAVELGIVLPRPDDIFWRLFNDGNY